MPSHLPSPRVPDSLAAPPLRWGVLGTGWIADQFVASLRANTRQVIQAVGSRSMASAQAAAARWEAAGAHGSYEALVADPAVDIVYVATPHNFHLPHALLAIAAGKHVLIEKPVGLDAAEARAIGEAAEAAGVFCMEAMWTLFLPKFDVVRQLLADGALGEVVAVLADMGERFDPPHRITRPELAGGPLLDLGTYAVTFATWILGAPDAVRAVATPAPGGTNGQLSIALRTPAGGTAALQTTILADSATTGSIIGREGRLELGSRFYLPGPATLYPRQGPPLHWAETKVEHAALHFEAAEVARRVSDGETSSPLRPWAETVMTLDVMDRVREATGLHFEKARLARDA
ncbi:Gfo/Idh/MocA family protein [Phycicoccus duodecadis]|uniref:Putative dehydrogenase n=1 Tax=Phycicoccus duodecadis TaxID=173053 RepID=A0A2N3YM24_9MICO|nr:Gfo/Idh/MocA family oxidoreductase [Phycicoccus duodecadis]PKW27892.1 putative dehydrogenase [Phycicoccus duodecadis]